MPVTFNDFKISKFLLNALAEKDFTTPTPIQEQSYKVIRSGKNVVGIAQTGTGKTLAFLLPMITDLKFTKDLHPRVLVIVPTRELVMQVVERAKWLTAKANLRVLGVYGGTNINTQKLKVAEGVDILVSTPGRLYDLALTKALNLKHIKRVAIDEVDVMLDLGFRFQLTNIFDLLPEKRQNTMFSATMTDEVHDFITDYFFEPVTISIAVSGTPLDNIEQFAYDVPNFYTKINLVKQIVEDRETFNKVLIFTSSKKKADMLHKHLEFDLGHELGIIHSNKSQNYRMRSVAQFDSGMNRILITTDVMARGLDLDTISHVINFNTPSFPENYMHRIGRSGRAEKKGVSIIFSAPYEQDQKLAIEKLMGVEIAKLPFPESVEVDTTLLPDERPASLVNEKDPNRNARKRLTGDAYHEKSEKNSKTNQGGSYRRELEKKYKKPQRRGDKIQNLKAKKRRKR